MNASTTRNKCALQTTAIILAYEQSSTPLLVDPEKVNANTSADETPKPTKCELPASSLDGACLQTYKGCELITYAIKTALKSNVCGITFITTNVYKKEIEGILANLASTLPGLDNTTINFEIYNKEAETALTRKTSYFELYGLSKYILDIAAHAAAATDSQAIYILSGHQPLIDASHLQGLAEGLASNSTIDCAVSWHSGMRRLPFLASARFLDGNYLKNLCTPSANYLYRPVPHLNIWELDLSAKKLMARVPTQKAPKTFLDELSIGALKAVRIAKLPAKEREAAASELSDADKKLVNIAIDIVPKMVPSAKDDLRALHEADALGQRCKGDFPVFEADEFKNSLVYLDTAATAQRLGAALQASYEFDTHANSNVYRSIYRLSKKATASLKNARAQVASFIGAESLSVIFTSNSTSACNLAASAWGEDHIATSDTIVLWAAEHHSNMLPWKMLAERKGARVITLPLDDAGRIDMDAYERALAQNPKLVCCSHIGNVMGIENPITQMAQAAHAKDTKFFLDASQSLAHTKLDVSELGADFIAFNGHKAYGPMGIGCLWTSPEVCKSMKPLGAGGGTVSHVDEKSYTLLPSPFRFEQGTPPVSQAVGMARALKYLQTIDMAKVREHDAALTAHLMRGFALIEGVSVFGNHIEDDGLRGLVSITLNGTDATGLVRSLDKMDVAIRGGGHCAMAFSSTMGIIGTGRFSFGIYNTAEDVEAAVVAVEATRQSLLE